MNKKEKACDKDYATFCMKANNNFRAEFNMATYELFKDKLFTTLDWHVKGAISGYWHRRLSSSDCLFLCDYFFLTCDWSDVESDNAYFILTVVFQTIKIYQMNKRSMLPNRHASFSVNLYNSTSSLITCLFLFVHGF
jgi:hypothetical protein